MVAELVYVSDDSEQEVSLTQVYQNHEITSPWRRVGRTTKVCAAARNICGSSVSNWLRVTLLATRILRLFPHFWNICAPLT
jgi:hypothetical protein